MFYFYPPLMFIALFQTMINQNVKNYADALPSGCRYDHYSSLFKPGDVTQPAITPNGSDELTPLECDNPEQEIYFSQAGFLSKKLFHICTMSSAGEHIIELKGDKNYVSYDLQYIKTNVPQPTPYFRCVNKSVPKVPIECFYYKYPSLFKDGDVTEPEDVRVNSWQFPDSLPTGGNAKDLGSPLKCKNGKGQKISHIGQKKLYDELHRKCHLKSEATFEIRITGSRDGAHAFITITQEIIHKSFNTQYFECVHTATAADIKKSEKVRKDTKITLKGETDDLAEIACREESVYTIECDHKTKVDFRCRPKNPGDQQTAGGKAYVLIKEGAEDAAKLCISVDKKIDQTIGVEVPSGCKYDHYPSLFKDGDVTEPEEIGFDYLELSYSLQTSENVKDLGSPLKCKNGKGQKIFHIGQKKLYDELHRKCHLTNEKTFEIGLYGSTDGANALLTITKETIYKKSGTPIFECVHTATAADIKISEIVREDTKITLKGKTDDLVEIACRKESIYTIQCNDNTSVDFKCRPKNPAEKEIAGEKAYILIKEGAEDAAKLCVSVDKKIDQTIGVEVPSRCKYDHYPSLFKDGDVTVPEEIGVDSLELSDSLQTSENVKDLGSPLKCKNGEGKKIFEILEHTFYDELKRTCHLTSEKTYEIRLTGSRDGANAFITITEETMFGRFDTPIFECVHTATAADIKLSEKVRKDTKITLKGRKDDLAEIACRKESVYTIECDKKTKVDFRCRQKNPGDQQTAGEKAYVFVKAEAEAQAKLCLSWGTTTAGNARVIVYLGLLLLLL